MKLDFLVISVVEVIHLFLKTLQLFEKFKSLTTNLSVEQTSTRNNLGDCMFKEKKIIIIIAPEMFYIGEFKISSILTKNILTTT